jgi:hypothetical protein
MNIDEWRAHVEERRQRYKEAGITDLNEERTKRMWNDPSVKAEDVPSTRFVFDVISGQFILPEEGQ